MKSSLPFIFSNSLTLPFFWSMTEESKNSVAAVKQQEFAGLTVKHKMTSYYERIASAWSKDLFL